MFARAPYRLSCLTLLLPRDNPSPTRPRAPKGPPMSYFLSSEKQSMIVAMLCEGMGIRPIERVANAHRDTIMRLGRDVGEGYARLHDKLFVNLSPARVELDEAWSFVHTKQAHVSDDDPREYGDQYSFIALDANSKAILAYHVGKRTKPNTIGFALDLASRLITEPQITSDGFDSYKDAIRIAFGSEADYAMLIKQYKADCAGEAAKRFTPAEVTRVQKIVVSGEPEEDDINTAFVERQNLTLRMLTRRFNRLTNAHSKSLRNHRAAFDLYVGYYNFCWIHSSLKKTPAMAAGVAREPWDVVRLISETKHLAHPYNEPIRPGVARYADYVKARQQAKRKDR